jgi:hypothetical protein
MKTVKTSFVLGSLIALLGCQASTPPAHGQATAFPSCALVAEDDVVINSDHGWALKAAWVDLDSLGFEESISSSTPKSKVGLRVHGGMFGDNPIPTGTTITVLELPCSEGGPQEEIVSKTLGSGSAIDFVVKDLEITCSTDISLAVEMRIDGELAILYPVLRCSDCQEDLK